MFNLSKGFKLNKTPQRLSKKAQTPTDPYYPDKVERINVPTNPTVPPQQAIPPPLPPMVPQRPIQPQEPEIPDVYEGDAVRIRLRDGRMAVCITDYADQTGIYGWYSAPRDGVEAHALEKALDMFVGYQIYNMAEHRPTKIVDLSQVALVEVIEEDAGWKVANEAGPHVNLLNDGDATQHNPMVSSNPVVNAALHRKKFLFFNYNSLDGMKATARRVTPLYVFIHPTTNNELLLSIDETKGGSFRSFAVANISNPKIGSNYSFNSGKMLKKVDKTLVNIEDNYEEEYEDKKERKRELKKDTIYIGLSGYKEYLEEVEERRDKKKKKKKKEHTKEAQVSKLVFKPFVKIIPELRKKNELSI